MKITKDQLSEMIGFEIPAEIRRTILKEVAESGKDIREIASQYNLPQMAILNESGQFQYNGQWITPAEWENINPLGSYGKIILIGTREMIEDHRNLKTGEAKKRLTERPK